MRTRARIWVTLFLLFGFNAIAFACADWRIDHPLRFGLFAVIALTSSILRARAPDLAGQMWGHPLFVVFGLLELSLAETTITTSACLIIETVWRRQNRVSLLEVYFSLANLVVAIAVMARLLAWLTPFGVPNPVLALSAGLVLFLFTTFPWASVVGLAENRSVVTVWREQYFTQLPPILWATMLGWTFHAVSRSAGWETATLGLPTVFLLHRTWRLHMERLEDAKVHAEHLAILHMRTIEALALAIEAKDTTTSDHLRRVQVYATEIGQRLGMNSGDLQALGAAAVLHDIGKLAVPEYIISKPGRLTPEEFERMKIHPIIGAEILEHVNFPYPVVPIVRAHHEKWNGSGYPYGLKGEDIPLGARILSVVDTLDALASDRQYRRALPLDEAMQRVSDESGTSFDPRVVAVLRDNYVELERKALAKKSTSLKLSLDLKVERGEAPGAGFEQAKRVEPAGGGAGRDLLETITSARREMQQLVDSATRAATMDREEFFARFAVRLQRLVPHDTIVIWLVEGTSLTPAWIHGAESRFFATLRIPVGEGLSGWVVENRKSVVNGNPAVESGYRNDSRQVSGMRSALSVPVERSGHVFGCVSLYQEARDGFTRDHMSVLQSLAPRFAAGLEALANRASQPSPKTAEPAQSWDSLTFLRHLSETLKRNSRLNTPVAVLVACVEGTESLPPDRLEAAIRAGSALLADEIADYEALCRIGSNDFAAVIIGASARTILTRLSRIRQTMREWDGLSLAAGCAQFPVDGRTPEELFAVAEGRVMGPMPAGAQTQSAGAVASGWVQ
ncbi:MAG: HD domain-containing protein [Bryobacteraceae bacterium]|nr:HD domain-containing protein [Bryobacteraceae bacterium]